MANNSKIWKGNWTFILAAAGSAVGLGNIWKFPYMAGENGGGAFVIIYLTCIVLIGFPVMMSEIFLGKYGRKSLFENGRNERPLISVITRLGLCLLYTSPSPRDAS